MDPYYVQRISQTRTPQGFTETNFTNLSSQMLNPGTLPQFFGNENTAEPMPLTLAQALGQPGGDRISGIVGSNISNMPRAETMPRSFETDTRSKFANFRTANMIAWNVPLSETQMHSD
jgi:hypothetical protein